ncbi:MAG TPA: class I SAM-dependent methyltransferase [Tepidisphaeraceae bacterium]|nr:class I SAM-dependent methyltransferase [Tepidisphaeraceae bacterium]
MHHYKLKQDPLSSHQQIAKLVRQMKRGPVLDVGSAQGMLGQLLQGSNLQLDGVEPNPEWAAAAKPLYRQMYEGTVESANLPKNHYKVIVCADVLEHTLNPTCVLKQLRSCGTKDAVFVVSLPNVAHIAVRLLLLCGQFPKMKRGLLDRTHLHFFTRETAVQMLRDAGLKVTRRQATVAPLSLVWPRGDGTLPFQALWHMQHWATKVWPNLFAYQWILVAEAVRE